MLYFCLLCSTLWDFDLSPISFIRFFDINFIYGLSMDLDFLKIF